MHARDGILEQPMGTRNRVGIELSYRPAGLCSPWTKDIKLNVVFTVGNRVYRLEIQSVMVVFRPRQYIQTVSSWGGGGGVLSSVGDHILQEFNTLFLARFKTYKIARPSQAKT
jgi:hypothetical protein